MNQFDQVARGALTAAFLIGATALPAVGQFVAIDPYQAPAATTQPAYGSAYVARSYGAPAQAYPPQTQAYPAQAHPAQAYPAQAHPAPGSPSPRVAQAAQLPAPTETLGAVTPVRPVPTMTPAPTMAPAPSAVAAPTSYNSYSSYPVTTGHPVAAGGCATGDCATGGCTTGDCGATYGSAPCMDSCYAAAPACDLGAPARRKRQWFGGLYGLYLDRAGDLGKAPVAYLTDTAGWTPTDPGYYPMPTDACLHTTDADTDGQGGGEIRFGSTFGGDPCGCAQPFAWEVGYWAIDDDYDQATLLYPGTLSAANTMRIYSQFRYDGLWQDLDGAGTTWAQRDIYTDDGMPADRDVDANDVRILGVRVRHRFQAQNLEINLWRFGTPACAPSLGLSNRLARRCSPGGCGVDACVDPCGAGCAPAACAPCRPPRRFFINGLAGFRYLRIDDDFGLDWQQAPVETDPTEPDYHDPPAGWPTAYTGFPADDPSVVFSRFEADNELVGFQLGCSMNWLIGCRWNIFADSNFGVYGNNISFVKSVYGGGASEITFANGDGFANVTGSETTVAYVGELRAGVGYQLSCNCRLTAAYRFMGIGGLALGVEEFQNTYWSSHATASHIDANNSIILHGLQTGVEFKY